MPNSYFMLHEGDLAYEGTVKQVKSMYEFQKRTDTMLDIYTEVAKEGAKFKGYIPTRVRSFIKTQMSRREDVYLTPDEAIEWGLADEVFTDWVNYRL